MSTNSKSQPGTVPQPLPPLPDADHALLSAVIETQNDITAVELDRSLVIHMIAERTHRLTGADGATVELIQGNHLACKAATGIVRPLADLLRPLDAGIAGKVLRTGALEHCQDTLDDNEVDLTRCREAGVRSLISMPLNHCGQQIGVIKVVSSRPSAFTTTHEAGLRLMAGVLAGALAHSAEFEAKKKLLEERTAALAALGESEERFRTACENAAIGMALVSPDGRWLKVNRSMCEIVGRTESELLATTFQAITHPDDLDADMEHVRELLAGETRSYQMVKRYFHRRGHIVWVQLNASLVRNEEGKPLYFISQLQDITGRKRVEDALRESEEDYRATFEVAGVGKAQVDLASGRFIRVNQKLCDITGYASDELQTMTFALLAHPDDLPDALALAQQMAAGKATEQTCEHRFIRKDGRVAWASVSAAVLRYANGLPIRAVCTIQDVTERKQAEWLERDRRQVLEMVARDLPLPRVLAQLSAAVERQVPGSSAAVITIQDGDIELHGDRLSTPWRLCLEKGGLSLAMHLSSTAWAVADRCGVTFVQSDPAWLEAREQAATEGIRATWAVVVQSTDDTPLGLLTVFCDQSRRPSRSESQTLDMAGKLATICVEHHARTRQLSHLVRHDALTGLPNRILYEDRVQQALAIARRNKTSLAVMVLDIDKFKAINDTFGHYAGDHLLQQFAQRLRPILRETDTMARIGGDEFVVVLPCIAGRDGAAAVAGKLIRSLSTPFDLGGQTISATCSIGVAVFPEDGEDAVSLQRTADAALYRQKECGRNGFSF